MTGTKVGQITYLKIDGEVYHLALRNGEPVFSSGTRALEGVPSDAFEIVWDDWSPGIGHAYLSAHHLLTDVKGALIPSPPIKTLTSGHGILDGRIEHSFEEQDSAGAWYKYFISTKGILKVDVSVDPPVIRKEYNLATTGFNASDRLGKPIKATSGGTTFWYIPCNNGDRVVKLTTPVEVDQGAGAADTFAAVTTITQGAAHFVQTPNGKITRLVSSFASSVTFQNRCTISILQRGSDIETNNNWGEKFEVGSQETFGQGLLSIGAFVIIRKQEGWLAAVENADGTIHFEDILPDGFNFERGTVSIGVKPQGAVWHGKLWLPTSSGLWRSFVTSAKPRGPDEIVGNEGLQNLGSQIRFGKFFSLTSGQKYIFAAYSPSVSGAGSNANGTLIYAREGLPGDGELTWHSLTTPQPATIDFTIATLQRNGAVAPRLWFADSQTLSYDLYYMPLSLSLDPWQGLGANVSYGGSASETVDLEGLWRQFPSDVLLREVHLTIEGSANTGEAWGFTAHIDGGTNVDLGTRTTTGSLFWTPRTNDETRSLAPKFSYTSPSDGNGNTDPLRLMRARLSGYYLPDVGDSLSFIVDVAKTAKEHKLSPERVVANLRALRSGGAKSYVDLYGTSGDVLVRTTDEDAAKRVAGVEGMHTIGVTAELLEYA